MTTSCDEVADPRRPASPGPLVRPGRAARRGPRGALSWAGVPLLAGLLACVTIGSPPAQRRYHRTESASSPSELVGAEECETCHDEVGGHALAPAYHADCEGCHGPGELHIDSEEVTDIRFPAAADCLACHENGRSTHLNWTSSPHARGGVLCSDCHDPHNREPWHVRAVAPVRGAVLRDARVTTRLCASCHAEIASRLDLPSHHPIREGMLGCTDCHGPHDGRRVALGARTALCTGCHQDHAGPWIYEHPPAAEDCGYCHSPHGSGVRDLLETSQPGVCISCHTIPVASTAHAQSAFTTPCTDCHGAIHGSYADAHLRR